MLLQNDAVTSLGTNVRKGSTIFFQKTTHYDTVFCMISCRTIHTTKMLLEIQGTYRAKNINTGLLRVEVEVADKSFKAIFISNY